jgi:hypothetical protein
LKIIGAARFQERRGTFILDLRRRALAAAVLRRRAAKQTQGERMAKPKLTAVAPLSYLAATAIDPPSIPSELGEHGQRLWQSVQSQYRVEDAGGIALLTQACLASDRVARLKKLIDRDGEMLKLPDGGMKSNPLLRDELGARAFIARTITQLGLNHEPTRHHAGRPPGHPGAV